LINLPGDSGGVRRVMWPVGTLYRSS